jgi:hypothetical protein
MEVDLSSIMVSVSEPTTPTYYMRLSAQDRAIPADVYIKNDAEEPVSMTKNQKTPQLTKISMSWLPKSVNVSRNSPRSYQRSKMQN